MWIGYLITGFFAGTISGMGIGGGAILIPALATFYAMEQQQAQSINLLYFIPTAAIAVYSHRKQGNIEKIGLLRLVIYGLIGAAAGASLALWVDPAILRRIFGGFLLIMGIIEFFKKGKEKNGTERI